MKVAIIGGGASGLTCAAAICRGNNNISVTVFEEKERVGKKILATGNGRCNMMNLNCSAEFFSNPEFVTPVLKKFNTADNLRFFADMGLYTRSDDEGRVYPMSNQASSVLDVLRTQCDASGVTTKCNSAVKEIKKVNGGFVVADEKFDKVVLCCGSKAAVKGFLGYDILKSLGHSVISPRPSLTKICVKESKFTKSLKGVRCKTKVTLSKKGVFVAKEKGEILFSEYGVSGIAVMQLSAYIARNRVSDFSDYTIKADFVPDMDIKELEKNIYSLITGRKSIKNEFLLCGFIPKKLGEMLLKSLGIDLGAEIGTLSKKQVSDIVSAVKGFSFHVTDLKGFDEAQVVSGGADTREFNPYTLESKKMKGFYCCGEILDIDGLCGGYNLTWAWSSARACAESISASKTLKGDNK